MVRATSRRLTHAFGSLYSLTRCPNGDSFNRVRMAVATCSEVISSSRGFARISLRPVAPRKFSDTVHHPAKTYTQGREKEEIERHTKNKKEACKFHSRKSKQRQKTSEYSRLVSFVCITHGNLGCGWWWWWWCSFFLVLYFVRSHFSNSFCCHNANTLTHIHIHTRHNLFARAAIAPLTLRRRTREGIKVVTTERWIKGIRRASGTRSKNRVLFCCTSQRVTGKEDDLTYLVLATRCDTGYPF